MRKILLLFITLSIFACGPDSYDTKKFLFDHPEIKFQVNSTGYMYDRKTSMGKLQELSCNREILTFYINDKTIEILLTNEFQRIGETKYMVKNYTGFWENSIAFQVMEEAVRDISKKESTVKKKTL